MRCVAIQVSMKQYADSNVTMRQNYGITSVKALFVDMNDMVIGFIESLGEENKYLSILIFI